MTFSNMKANLGSKQKLLLYVQVVWWIPKNMSIWWLKTEEGAHRCKHLYFHSNCGSFGTTLIWYLMSSVLAENSRHLENLDPQFCSSELTDAIHSTAWIYFPWEARRTVGFPAPQFPEFPQLSTDTVRLFLAKVPFCLILNLSHAPITPNFLSSSSREIVGDYVEK
jgi:hypothetical protein